MKRAVVTSLCLLLLAGCAQRPLVEPDSGRLNVVTTTGLLRDLVQNVGGDRVKVVSIIPDGADPHTYEPTLRDARNVVYADVAFSNYALLEEHAVIETLDANLPKRAPNVSLAEESAKYGADLIPLVENVDLDTIWLGLRAFGTGDKLGADRTSQVELSAVAATGPGDIHAYLTGTFGDTEQYFDSSDGFDAASGYRNDTVDLPTDAHTHLSWAFTKRGVYTLTLRARLKRSDTATPVDLGTGTFTFAVGVKPEQVGGPGAVVLDSGHADLTANLDTGQMQVRHDPDGTGKSQVYVPDQVVIDVPAKAMIEIPGDPQYRFLGHPGKQIYQLAQAVLGKHVHGEIDPHLWQNVRNALAYVRLIRDTLIKKDPADASTFRANAESYLRQLGTADDQVRATIDRIPPANRYLVTTHDAFGYLAEAYGMKIGGFVTANPSAEPSLADRRKLTETIRALKVPAVFLEPNLRARSSTLTEVAAEQQVRVCTIYGDTFDERVTIYLQLVRFNARSLLRCLSNPDDREDHR